MFCPVCNAQLPDEALSCPNCGTPIDAGLFPASSLQPAADMNFPRSQPDAQPQPQPEAQPQFQPQPEAQPQFQPQPEPQFQPQPQYPYPMNPGMPPQQFNYVYTPPVIDENTFFATHPQYRPLGAWAYFGYSLLFSIPLAGFILLIVFSFSSGNINRRSFARSYWCKLAIILIIILVIFLILFAGGYRVSRYF